MGDFEAAIRRIEQYRICLERDSRLGIVPADARAALDGCFRELESVLAAARIEIEGVGGADAEFGARFVVACSILGLRTFRRMYREQEGRRLALVAEGVGTEARALLERLSVRLEPTAA